MQHSLGPLKFESQVFIVSKLLQRRPITSHPLGTFPSIRSGAKQHVRVVGSFSSFMCPFFFPIATTTASSSFFQLSGKYLLALSQGSPSLGQLDFCASVAGKVENAAGVGGCRLVLEQCLRSPAPLAQQELLAKPQSQ